MKKPTPLIPLFLVIFIDTFGYFLVMPVILKLFIQTHSALLPTNTSVSVRHWLYGITLGLSPLAFITLSPFIGRLSDRFGRKRVIAGCLYASLAGFALPIAGIAYRHISLIMLGRFIAGAGTTSQPVAQAAITDFSNGKQRAFNLSLIGFSMTLAMVAGPLAGSYLSDSNWIAWFSLTTPYWFGTLLAVINIALLYATFIDTSVSISSTDSKKVNQSRLFSPPLLLVLTAFFMLEMSWSGFYQACFLFLGSEFHFSTNSISQFAAYSGLWMSLGLTVVFRFWIKNTKVSRIAATSLIVILVCLMAQLQFSTASILWLLTAPIALFVGTAYPALLQRVSEITPQDHQGWMLGVASTLLGLAWMITGLIGPQLVTKNDKPILVLCAATIAIGALCLINNRYNCRDLD